MYQIYISWKGGNQVQSIQADRLKITNTSNLNSVTYYNNSFFIQGLSATQGSKTVGGCIIPANVKTVRIKTTGLRAYFYDRDYWIRMNEINGPFNL